MDGKAGLIFLAYQMNFSRQKRASRENAEEMVIMWRNIDWSPAFLFPIEFTGVCMVSCCLACNKSFIRGRMAEISFR
jgi:hypothetical protein